MRPSGTPAAPAPAEAQDRRGGRGAAGDARLLHAAGRAGGLDAPVAGGLDGEAEVRGGERLGRDGAAGPEKNEIKPWLKDEWVIPPEKSAEFVWHMEDVLDVYHRPHD